MSKISWLYLCGSISSLSFLFCWSICSLFSSDMLFWLLFITNLCPTLCNPDGCSRLLCPWYFSGKNTGMGCHFLLQGIFPTQESSPHYLHCRQILYCWATREAHCPDYYSFKVNFKFSDIIPPILFFSIVLAIQDLLSFQINFIINVLYSK